MTYQHVILLIWTGVIIHTEPYTCTNHVLKGNSDNFGDSKLSCNGFKHIVLTNRKTKSFDLYRFFLLLWQLHILNINIGIVSIIGCIYLLKKRNLKHTRIILKHIALQHWERVESFFFSSEHPPPFPIYYRV